MELAERFSFFSFVKKENVKKSRDHFENQKKMSKKRLPQIDGEVILDGLTDNVESLVLTLSDLATSNITEENSTLPSIGLNEDGTLGLFEDSEQVPFSRFERGVTQEKLIVKKEIIVSSDQVDKQSVEEIDFNKNDLTSSNNCLSSFIFIIK